MNKNTLFSFLVVAIAISLLSGMPSFLKMILGNLSVMDNPKEISLSPIACFLLGLGFVGVWFWTKIAESEKVLGLRRFVAGLVLIAVCVFGLQALLNVAWS
jgi:hypothetical protein